MDDLLSTSGSTDLLVRLMVSVGIGFLIGLEREYAKRVVEKDEHIFAGVRTYTLFTLFGFLAAFLSDHYGVWIMAASLLGFTAMLITAYTLTAHKGDYGGTTELSSILAFLLGAVCFDGHMLLAIIVTVIITALLSLKLPLHRFIAGLTMAEIRAFIQFVIISAVVLPFLPDSDFGPYMVWNLKDIWSMVVLVSGISLVAFLLTKFLGHRAGTILTGALGGMVSSTAVTLGLSRQAHAQGASVGRTAAVGIIAACTIMFLRMLLEVWVVNAALAARLIIPLMAIAAIGLVVALVLHRRSPAEDTGSDLIKNPLNFWMAVQFGLLFMAVQWMVAYAMDHIGNAGPYVASSLGGLTDIDAITLSLARVGTTAGNAPVLARSILLAGLTNTVVKSLIVITIGGPHIRRYAGMGFAVILAGAITAFFLM